MNVVSADSISNIYSGAAPSYSAPGYSTAAGNMFSTERHVECDPGQQHLLVGGSTIGSSLVAATPAGNILYDWNNEQLFARFNVVGH